VIVKKLRKLKLRLTDLLYKKMINHNSKIVELERFFNKISFKVDLIVEVKDCKAMTRINRRIIMNIK
jgi:hypothetical protein